MEWSIQEIAKKAGTTSRTLRHYGELGLLPPSRTGANGYRYYDQDALVRLQRILLLRQLGLPLAAIGDVLAGQRDTEAALHTHLLLLEQERERIGRQIASVRTTLLRTTEGAALMADEVLDGFDHTRYEAEVTERWGGDAYREGDRRWHGLGAAAKAAHLAAHEELARDWGAARRAGRAADDEVVRELARRHVEWLSATVTPTAAYLTGLGETYVADPRFGRHYDRHGEGTAALVRDALADFARRRPELGGGAPASP
ncbi:TipAS antibiotic-recognition domain-containing protein [uncultured Streptomyces sp.]|uniref:MerR family transcriptional regulator n=1 Tax=uncultured Streptomyces sp. TaxID=174707 RepID=UPI002602DAEB|nr:TipAS antibiotic-recognition domain-containing protein [uncultured Streptomyces sp.]